MSHRFHRRSGTIFTATPPDGDFLDSADVHRARSHDDGRFGRWGHCMVAPIRATCDLQIDQSIRQAVAPHDLAHNQTQCCRGHRHRHVERAETARKPIRVPLLVGQQPVDNGTHFVNRIGKLQAAILDMDAGLRVRKIPAVDICNATDGQRWQRDCDSRVERLIQPRRGHTE